MRQFLATVAGLAAGVLVIMLVQYIGHRIVKVEINATTPEEFIEAVKNLPPKAFIPVAISHALGALIGMIISRRVTKKINCSNHLCWCDINAYDTGELTFLSTPCLVLGSRSWFNRTYVDRFYNYTKESVIL